MEHTTSSGTIFYPAEDPELVYIQPPGVYRFAVSRADLIEYAERLLAERGNAGCLTGEARERWERTQQDSYSLGDLCASHQDVPRLIEQVEGLRYGHRAMAEHLHTLLQRYGKEMPHDASGTLVTLIAIAEHYGSGGK